MADQVQQAGQRGAQAASQQGDAPRQSQRAGGQRTAQGASQERSQAAAQSAQPSEAGRPAAQAGSELHQAEETRRPWAAACRRDRDRGRAAVHCDPHRAIRVGLLKLARSWADEGQVYSAINTYKMVLERYPCSGAADAAVEEMLELADQLEDCGMYFTALNIFNTMEGLV